ncbi:MAG: carbon starvation protein A [Acidobacteriota bacterium]
MEVVALLLVCSIGFLVAYHTYGRFLARKIFGLDERNPTPAETLQDGIDYVPTKKEIVFGHHFTSIAGTGPIVGPAIGVIWGWIPAVLWVCFGSIFMGAVHDLGALAVSLRNRGHSISEVAGRYINHRVRLLFFIVVFLTVLIIIAVFGVVIAAIFDRFPSAVVPVWLQIPIAMLLGRAVYRRGWGIVPCTAVAVAAMYATMALGTAYPVQITGALGLPATGFWVLILLVYAWIASTLPVQTLLQPRDYINAWQLFVAMGVLTAGVFVGAATTNLEFVAPAVNSSPPGGTPHWWPTLFVIIACGAISGFHSLVASGTSPKQLANEGEAQFVGYGAMLLEGFLALLVILCVTAGIGLGVGTGDELLRGSGAWQHFYGVWIGERGLSDKIAPVIEGAARLMGGLGLPHAFGITLMGVFIASFAGTTLDTAVRLQRYVIGELAEELGLKRWSGRYSATTVAVLTAAALAFATGADGTGAMRLWPLFGTSNQLLAALALLVVTNYLRREAGVKYLVTALPCLVMLVVTNWAMIESIGRFYTAGNLLLLGISVVLLFVAFWMTAEATLAFARGGPVRKTVERTAALPEIG